MRYLGRMVGEAQLTHDGDPVGRASYEFEGFVESRGRIVSSGQIQMSRPDSSKRFSDGAAFGFAPTTAVSSI